MMEHPPCWPQGQRCPNDCAKQLYDHRVIYNHTRHWGNWTGFRMAGRELVAPDGQRIRVCCGGIRWSCVDMRNAALAPE